MWGLSDCSRVEVVHLQALKRFLNFFLRAPNIIVYGETGRYPLNINASIRAVKYGLRVLNMDDSMFPLKAYKMMLLSGYNDSWANMIKDLLHRYEFDSVTFFHIFSYCLISYFESCFVTSVNYTFTCILCTPAFDLPCH